MYSCQIKKHILFGIVITFGLCGYVLGIDLTDEIYTRFKDAYDLGLADEYLNVPYSPNFSKDPFGEAMELYEGMSSQTKVAGVKYVEKALALKGCGLSKQKQWAIEYYFLPEFRGEIARLMKMEMGDYASNNYTFDEGVIIDYCTEFYNCISYKPGGDAFDESKKITSATPEDVKTHCKEFFQTNYREGQAEEKRVQNLQIARLGNDKYVNATIEDSPYDVMKDLGVVGEISFLQAQKPINPVFFDLPVFAKSKESLLNGESGGGGDSVEETYGGVVPVVDEISLGGSKELVTKVPSLEGVSLGGSEKIKEPTISTEKQVGQLLDKNNTEITISSDRVQTIGERGSSNASNGLQASNGSVKPLSRAKSLTIEGYDTLIEGLGAYRLNDDKSAYYGSLCRDEEEEPVPQSFNEEQKPTTRDTIVGDKVVDSTKVEYQELVDYMLEAVTSYSSISEEKAKEIEKKSLNKDDISNITADETEALAKEILGCYQSCVGLSVDQQLTCMLKCSCGEIKSPIFNPDINPGMGPIFMIRFCAVPAVNPKYFYGGSDGTDSWSSTLLGGTSSSGKGSAGRGGSSNGRGGVSGGGNGGGGVSGGGNGGGGNGGGSSSNEGNSSAREQIGPSFSVGGTRMVSMEKGINEILGVIEKLAREGRLGMWTQQYNFLDSTTKMMDVADTFSFTVASDKKKMGEKVGEPTEEYLQRTMKTKNDYWLLINHVANPLDNPATKNYYRLVESPQGEIVSDVSPDTNTDLTKQSQGYLNVAPGFIVDQSENSNAARYAKISELFADWLDFEGDFWAEKVEYLKEMDEYAKALYAKKG